MDAKSVNPMLLRVYRVLDNEGRDCIAIDGICADGTTGHVLIRHDYVPLLIASLAENLGHIIDGAKI